MLTAFHGVCWNRYALRKYADPRYGGTSKNVVNALENLAVLTDSLIPAKRLGQRVFHGAAPTIQDQIPQAATKDALAAFSQSKGADGVEVYSHVLTDEMCDTIVALFEASKADHYPGNIIRDNRVVVDLTVKDTVEFDITETTSDEWGRIDQTLLQAMTMTVAKYEHKYPGLSQLPSPLWDEGFRIKRYNPKKKKKKGNGFFSWHVDSADGNSCRELAFVFYLSNVPSGGETLFRAPSARAVRPEKGAVLVFPTSHLFLHAAAPPVGAPKYAISNFLTSCDYMARLNK